MGATLFCNLSSSPNVAYTFSFAVVCREEDLFTSRKTNHFALRCLSKSKKKSPSLRAVSLSAASLYIKSIIIKCILVFFDRRRRRRLGRKEEKEEKKNTREEKKKKGVTKKKRAFARAPPPQNFFLCRFSALFSKTQQRVFVMGACASAPLLASSGSRRASEASSATIGGGEESASSVFFSRSRGGRRRGATKRRRTRRTRRTKSRAYAKSLFDDERAKRSKKILYEGVCSIPGGSKYDSFEGYEVDLSHKSKDFQKWMKDVKFHDPKEFDEWNSETMQVLDEMIEVATRRCEEHIKTLPEDDPEMIYRTLKTFKRGIPEVREEEEEEEEGEEEEEEEEVEEEVTVTNEDGTTTTTTQTVKRIKKKKKKSLFANRPQPPKIPQIMHEAVCKALQDPDIESWTSTSPEIEEAFDKDFEYFTIDGATIRGREFAFSRMDKAIVDLRNRMIGSTRSKRQIKSNAMNVEGPTYVGRGDEKHITKWEVLYKFDMLLMKVKICELFEVNEETGLVIKLSRFRI